MEVLVYSKVGCPSCVNVKKLLESKKIPYQTVDLSDDTARQSFYNEVGNGVRSMPQVFIDNERVGGLNETMTDPRIRQYKPL